MNPENPVNHVKKKEHGPRRAQSRKED